MKSKIHRATITSVDLHYEASLTVEEDPARGGHQVVNVNTGTRSTTCVIPAARGSGTIQLNGAAERLGVRATP